MTTTVTISLEEFDGLRNRVSALQTEVTNLRDAVKAANAVDPSERVPRLLETITTALVVVRFAVGNLDPEIVRGWPHADLVKLAGFLDQIPSVDADLPAELRVFAREASEWERYRGEIDWTRRKT